MIEGRPSQTAFGVARRRAVHQLWDDPKVFDDPLAVRIIGREAAAELEQNPPADFLPSRFLRAFLAVRSRYAEDQLALAVERGVLQYVVLGAGLDTFAYRNPFKDVRVFEVDHPATQAWKTRLLHAAKIEIPSSLHYAPVDFERETLPNGLAMAGFKKEEPAFFSWLGVTPYLERETVLSTLRWIVSACPQNGVTFDYSVPRAALAPTQQAAFDALTARVAAAGEPFISFFDPKEFVAELSAMGFGAIEDLDNKAINFRYFRERTDGLAV